MKHARDAALDTIEPLLEELRRIEGMVEKKRGVFYRRSQAFLHFHEDPAGMFVDVRIPTDPDGPSAHPSDPDGWQRRAANTMRERRALVAAVRRALKPRR